MNKELIDYLDEKFNDIDENFGQMNEKFDKVFNGQDKIVNRLDSLEQEETISTELYQKHETEIQDHKKRILSLESK